METLPDMVPMLPMENYPNPIPEENATRLSPTNFSIMRDASLALCCIISAMTSEDSLTVPVAPALANLTVVTPWLLLVMHDPACRQPIYNLLVSRVSLQQNENKINSDVTNNRLFKFPRSLGPQRIIDRIKSRSKV